MARQAYTREDLCRLLRITPRQLKRWEAQKLIPAVATYGFRELIGLRALVQLRKDRVPGAQIKRAVLALGEKLSHIQDPLSQLKLYSDAGKIHVEVDGEAMEAESGQLLLNFNKGELKQLLEFKAKPSPNLERQQRAEAERWFQQGLELEQSGAPANEIIETYQKALELDPKSAGAMVNLGTVYFNLRNWEESERFYLQAIEVDPDYALAHFDLANLYDERGNRNKALEHYHNALRLSPNYADAHYNLALLYQGSNQALKAVRHWTTYLKLDPTSQWANIARRELAKLRRIAVLPGLRAVKLPDAPSRLQ
jgi:tetratricopeptide (TPR) repeat protein